MTEFTEEQLSDIANAVGSILTDAKVRVDTPIPHPQSLARQQLVDKVVERLRPKPKFANGQVVHYLDDGGYGTYDNIFTVRECRALTIPEMGPPVVNLVDAIADARAANTPTPIYSAWRELINIHGGTLTYG